jgi:hypothetical protein
VKTTLEILTVLGWAAGAIVAGAWYLDYRERQR